MGMEQSVTFGAEVPPWAAVAALLAGHGYPVQMRMIDGQLAFPDEAPGDDWRELRVGTGQGMVTLRRDGGRVAFVTWGNADENARQVWNALTWAFAQAGGGRVQTAAGERSAAEFRQGAELPADLKPA